MLKKWMAALLTAVLMLTMLSGLTASAAGEADLIVEDLKWTGGDGQVKPQTALTLTAVVKNAGGAAVTQPVDVVFAFGGTEIARGTTVGGMAAGARQSVSVKWTAVAGDKMVSARVDAADVVKEASEKNNTRQRNLRVANDRVAPVFNADAVNEAGMFDLTLNDDFNDTSAFDNQKTGAEGYKWYIRRRWAQEDMKPGTDYYVKDGVLTIAYEDATYTIGASTVDCKTHVGYIFTHGYIEARVRLPKATDAVSKTGVWSLPIENWAEGLKGGRYVEADWMEYFGKNEYFGITLHDMESTSSGKNWYVGSAGTAKNKKYQVLNDEDWHVMGWLWEEDRLRCYVDGELYYDQKYSANDIPLPMNSVKEGDIQFEGVFDVMDSQKMMLFIGGSSTMPMQFDYLRIWQQGGTPPATATTKKTVATTKKPVATTQKPVATTVKKTSPTAAAPVTSDTVTTVTEADTTETTVSATESVTTATTTSKGNGSDPFPWVVAVPIAVAAVIVIAVAVIVIAAVAVIVKKKK